MDAQQPKVEFGKRPPLPEAPEVPVKRSGHVALLVMGTIAAGTAAYALMPGSRCKPLSTETARAAQPDTCTDNRSSGSSFWRSRYFSGGSWSRSSTAGSSESQSGGVTRGGFGSSGHAFGSSSSS